MAVFAEEMLTTNLCIHNREDRCIPGFELFHEALMRVSIYELSCFHVHKFDSCCFHVAHADVLFHYQV